MREKEKKEEDKSNKGLSIKENTEVILILISLN